jgi:hypothetical protein
VTKSYHAIALENASRKAGLVRGNYLGKGGPGAEVAGLDLGR